MMKILSIPQQTTLPPLSKTPPPLTTPLLPSPSRTWRLYSGGAKGFSTANFKDRRKLIPSKQERNPNNNSNNNNPATDDKIPDVVWGRMIQRIMFFVGVPLVIGFAALLTINALKEQGLWDAPKWVPFVTTFVTFGTSTLGIAYGSLSTSLDADEKGSALGFEQVGKNWEEMWEEDDESRRDNQ